MKTELSEEIIDAADEAFAIGYDQFDGEVLITGRVLRVERLNEELAKTFTAYDEAEDEADNPLVEIEYEIWVLPKSFDLHNPDELSYRRDKVIFESETLVSGSAVSYGLGPEYGQLSWDQLEWLSGRAKEVNLPTEMYEEYISKICETREENIWTYFDNDPDADIPENLPNMLSDFYQRIRVEVRKREAERSRKYALAENEKTMPIAELKFNLPAPSSFKDLDGGTKVLMTSTHHTQRLFVGAQKCPEKKNAWSINVSIAKVGGGASLHFAKRAEIEYLIEGCPTIDELKSRIIESVDVGEIQARLGK